MKKKIKIILLLFLCTLLISSPELLAQGILGATKSCEDLIPKNKDKKLNVSIAQQCKRVWETNSGIGLAGPYGTYKRHSFDGVATIDRDDFGNILSKSIAVSVIIQNKKGNCKVAYILFNMAYEGGSSYGSPSNGYVHGSSDKVDCACIETLPDWLGTGSTGGNSETQGGGGPTKNSETKPNKTVKDGPYEYKSPSGDYILTGTYADGMKTGLWKESGPNGILFSEKNYLNDKLNGESKLYSRGILGAIAEYKDDKLNGLQKEFDDNGDVNCITEYKDGKIHGKRQQYKKGTIFREQMYVDGGLNGKTTEYRDGKKYEEITYVNGKKNGESIKYYIETGTVQSIESYTDDKRNGIYKAYSKTGKLESEGNYKDGIKDGEWKKYDAAGKEIEKLFYVDGRQEK